VWQSARVAPEASLHTLPPSKTRTVTLARNHRLEPGSVWVIGSSMRRRKMMTLCWERVCRGWMTTLARAWRIWGQDWTHWMAG
jgi:hypothetical protein